MNFKVPWGVGSWALTFALRLCYLLFGFVFVAFDLGELKEFGRSRMEFRASILA